MARTVDQEQRARRRADILDAAQQLVLTRGYEQTTIEDVRRLAGLSNGAFFHYFSSKPALLEAFVERIRAETEGSLLPVVDDPDRTALDKLQGIFDALDQLRTAQRATVVDLLRVWYSDGNALVRRRVDDATRTQRAPLLARIVRQGIREGLLQTSHPDEIADAVLALTQRMGDAHAALLLAGADELTTEGIDRATSAIITVHAAFLDAIERVLGAPEGFLRRTDAEAVARWLTALRNPPSTPDQEKRR